MLPVAKESARAELVGGPTEPTDRASQHRDQPIDRDHQNVLLKPLDAACANQADHWHRAASTPPPTPARQPRRLFAHPSEMAIVVRPASSSRSRTRRRSARSPTSRCPLAPATAASDAAATPPSEAARTRAGPRPPSERPRGCARRATASGERRTRARGRGREWRRPRIPPRRPRRAAQAAHLRRSPSLPSRPLTAAGTAGDARSSRYDLPDDGAGDHRRSPMGPDAGHAPMVSPAADGSARASFPAITAPAPLRA